MTDVRQRPLRQAPPAPLLSALVLSIIGLGVAAYLTYEHFDTGSTLACPGTGRIDCVRVTTSQYSHVLGIPVAVLGLVFFAVMLVLLAASFTRSAPTSRPALRVLRVGWASIGLLSVLYLVWAELYGVGAICLWCTGVHVLTFLVFVLVLFADAFALPQDDEEEALPLR